MSEAGDGFLAGRISFAHQLGQLEGRITALERKVDMFEQRIEARLAGIDGKLDRLTTLLNLGQGGWKALVLLASLAGGIAALLKWLLSLTFIRVTGAP